MKGQMMLIVLLAMTDLDAALGDPVPGEPLWLTEHLRTNIAAMADEQPALMDVLFAEDRRGVEVPITSISTSVLNHAVLWIKDVVRREWLPADIENRLVAYKDVKQWEKKDKAGVVFSVREGDFLTLEYEAGGHKIHIQESGVSISVRFDLGTRQSLAPDCSIFIQKCLTDFLNFPDEWSKDFTIEKRGVLCRARMLNKRSTVSGWWDTIDVLTDGSFFFVTLVEITSQLHNPQASPGLPNRF